MNDVIVHFSDEVSKYKGPGGSRSIAAASVVTGNLPLGRAVGALPDGRKAGEAIAEGGVSPHQGRNVSGPTAAMMSVAKLDHVKLSKLHDMTLRLDGLYDVIVELEEKIEDVKLRRKAVEQDAITLENIYTLLANFDKVYDKISDEEKKSLISSLIKEIEIFPCGEAELPLKSILFNFPVYKDGGDVCGSLWDKSTHVSTFKD